MRVSQFSPVARWMVANSSDFIFVPDDDGAVFTFEFQVLRRFSDDGVREDVIVFAHAHVFRNEAWDSMMLPSSDFTPWPMTAYGPIFTL